MQFTRTLNRTHGLAQDGALNGLRERNQMAVFVEVECCLPHAKIPLFDLG